MKSSWVTKRNAVVSLLIAVLSCFLMYVLVVQAAEPASEEDPIVSASYVDAKINDLKSFLDKNLTVLANKTIDLSLAISEATQSSAKRSTFTPILLKNGQKLIAADSAEIILRSGKAKGIASKAGGLVDISNPNGLDIKQDGNIPPNHLLLIPRDDGRGIRIISDEAWVMIKGDYNIEN